MEPYITDIPAYSKTQWAISKRNAMLADVGFEPVTDRVFGRIEHFLKVSRQRCRVQTPDHGLDPPNGGGSHGELSKTEASKRKRASKGLPAISPQRLTGTPTALH